MPDISIQVNIMAVAVASLAAFALGAIWYSVLFGKQWVKAHGFTEAQVAEMQKAAGPGYLVSLVGYVVMGLVFSALITYTGFTEVTEGLWLGFLLWGGFALTTGITNAIFSGKSMSANWIDTGYQLVYILAMAAILTAWR